MNNFSIVSDKATLGSNVKIGRFCIVEDGVTIGDNTILEDYTMVLAGSSIGSNTKIGTYCKVGKKVSIGNNCSFTSYCEIRDNCSLGNNVTMGSRTTLSAGTVVDDDVIMKYGFVVTDTPDLKHNDVKKVGRLGKGSRFGANVVIMPAVNIGENVEIGACSQVRHDVPNNEIWYGSPAKFYKKI
jgi:UDP-2-acetamido-3-amino-2,3-dideoxy-glucuronate N-acetyltransferase